MDISKFKFEITASIVLTRLQSLVSIQYIALALLYRVKVVLMLFCLCEFAQESELSIQVSSFHAVLEL